ncbi:penicillin-binding protein [Peribacillus butanolivorans]|nr:penicillin-binding protein [Peribacillus butanolivorans]
MNEYRNEYGPEHYNDERFFPFFPLLAPVAFVAGLAIGPLLFNRPYYPPYPPPYPPAYPPYPAYPAYQGFQGYPQQFGAQAGVSENINIYTH